MSTPFSPGADTNNDAIVVERATVVELALPATADFDVSGAQHVVGDALTNAGVALLANGLVYNPNLHVIKLLRLGALKLYFFLLFFFCITNKLAIY